MTSPSPGAEARATWRGSCHCGAVQFEVDLVLDHVRSCDCSLCRRRGILGHRVAEEHLRILTPLEAMSLYQFHTRTAKDYFCPTCGVLPFRRPRTAPEQWTINVRCLEGVDLDAIPVERVYGSRLP
ncbi:MAG: GFA family protein [Caulobacteraceae bacterium]